ncbi:hypothetical protein [Brachybacterium sp. UMB0905]|uniref:hypothetical protein n=1 Tax=Brachybacterium sp. UMB0905 TaxID=2069310 RepID=UPI00130404EA|nr:hypothetical protein [Brachybacterium sp. UMB0905]
MTPAPVDYRDDDPRLLELGPAVPVDHPGHPCSDWNLYGRPAPAPWGSYMDTTPLPLPRDRRGPIATALDTAARYRQEVAL